MGIKQTTIEPAIVAAAYGSGDVLGTLNTVSLNIAGSGGKLVGVTLTDIDNLKKGVRLYFFNALPATIADNAAFALSDADAEKLVGTVSFITADYTTINNNAYAEKRETNLQFDRSLRRLYVYAVTTEAITYTIATPLLFKLFIER